MAAALPGALPADPEPHLVLAAKVAALADGGELLPCTNSLLPTSEDPDERALAARTLCPGCPVLEQCAAVGVNESFGVWGGVDRSKSKTGRRRVA